MGSRTIHVDDQEIIRIVNVSFNLLTNIHLQATLVEHIDPIYRVLVRVRPIFNQMNLEHKHQVIWRVFVRVLNTQERKRFSFLFVYSSDNW